MGGVRRVCLGLDVCGAELLLGCRWHPWLATLGVEIERLVLARDPLAVLVGGWGVGVAKVIGGLLPLTLVQPWGKRVPRRLMLVALWGGGIGMTLYGTASFVQHALMMTGAIELPAGLGMTGARWHLMLWDPWWTLGGVLFMATAWLASRYHHE